MEGEKKPREEEAGLDDVTIQETVESPNSTGWRSWSWTSPRKKAVASEPDLRKHARLWRAASSAKEGHSRVDHDQPRHNSVALAKYINTHTSRLAADREHQRHHECSERTSARGAARAAPAGLHAATVLHASMGCSTEIRRTRAARRAPRGGVRRGASFKNGGVAVQNGCPKPP